MITIKSASLLTAMAWLAACSSTPVAPPPAPPKAAVATATPATPVPAPPAAAPRAAPASSVATVTLPEYLDPKSSLSTERSVFFDFDEFTVKNQHQALIERHGKYLAAHPAVAIKIEGNTDERGGVEYNLALGQKRAEAVLRALRIYGVKDAQMEATSWGESRPKVPAHDEAAWAQNRRADLSYPAK